METIEFAEVDRIGEVTLDAISEAEKFNKWMFDVILPFSKGRVLEIGSGIGNISAHFLNAGFNIHLTDIRYQYCNRLNTRFDSEPLFLGAEIMDLVDPEFDSKFATQFQTYDTIVALNVIEHIKDDLTAIANCKKLLKTGGHLIILVPSYDALYNKFDVELGHYRRYRKSSLSALFQKNDLEILTKRYFNLAGILGWFVTGHLQENESIPRSQMKLYNKLVPLFKLIDRISFNRVGLSTIVVGRKK